jgi:ParB family chromosome partitioning protein
VQPDDGAAAAQLASVSPALIAAYRAGEMTLDQLMTFTVSDDHGRQEKV